MNEYRLLRSLVFAVFTVILALHLAGTLRYPTRPASVTQNPLLAAPKH